MVTEWALPASRPPPPQVIPSSGSGAQDVRRGAGPARVAAGNCVVCGRNSATAIVNQGWAGAGFVCVLPGGFRPSLSLHGSGARATHKRARSTAPAAAAPPAPKNAPSPKVVAYPEFMLDVNL